MARALPLPLLLLLRNRGGLHSAAQAPVILLLLLPATMFDGAAEPPPDASLFRRVESLERGPRHHLSLIVEVSRADRALGFICSAWPDNLTVRHVLTLSGPGSTGDRGGRDFTKLEPAEREAVRKFLQEREVDGDLAEFLHDYVHGQQGKDGAAPVVEDGGIIR